MPGATTRYRLDKEPTNNSTCDTRWVPVGTQTSVIVPRLAFASQYSWEVRATNGVVPVSFIQADAPATSRTGRWWTFRTAKIPTVTVAPTDPLAGEAGPDRGVLTVRRMGDTTDDLRVGVEIEGSADLTDDYTLAGMDSDDTGRFVTIPAGKTGLPLVVTPVDDAISEGRETVVVKVLPGDGYVVGSPRAATVAIVDNDECPDGADLVVAFLSAPPMAGAGQSLPLKFTTRNQAGATAAPSTTRLYLSVDGIVSRDDLELGNEGVPELGGFEGLPGSKFVLIPETTVAGKYYVLAKADADLAVCESDESNNGRSKVIYIGPDLVVSWLMLAGEPTVGGDVSIVVETKNMGGVAVGPSITSLSLSRDTIASEQDVAIAEIAVPALE